ncbi:hypothetical protein N8I77_010459 [Diaporthe amygdali]|uniref:HMG box domain-containing protein n=1 Tax=Phomopsis amygdali TaxID=1214568 RepID=A0AAD9W111_PHOAM|nr:hypothetical protein N8I77_010459 [Diaporthe amygdali]
MATLHQHLLDSNAVLRKASQTVDFHTSPTLAYLLACVSNTGMIPNCTGNAYDLLNIIEGMGVQLHAHNPAKVCAVDAVIWNMMDANEKNFVITVFEEILQQQCIVIRDNSSATRLFVGPVETLRIVNPILNNTKLPRPPNPFIIYRSERHQSVKEAHPEAKNNDISKILGRQWQQEPEEVRDAYKKKSEDIKQEFMRVYPDYKYKPRKSSEVKRRNRRATSDTQ